MGGLTNAVAAGSPTQRILAESQVMERPVWSVMLPSWTISESGPATEKSELHFLTSPAMPCKKFSRWSVLAKPAVRAASFSTNSASRFFGKITGLPFKCIAGE